MRQAVLEVDSPFHVYGPYLSTLASTYHSHRPRTRASLPRSRRFGPLPNSPFPIPHSPFPIPHDIRSGKEEEEEGGKKEKGQARIAHAALSGRAFVLRVRLALRRRMELLPEMGKHCHLTFCNSTRRENLFPMLPNQPGPPTPPVQSQAALHSNSFISGIQWRRYDSEGMRVGRRGRGGPELPTLGVEEHPKTPMMLLLLLLLMMMIMEGYAALGTLVVCMMQ